MIINGKPVDLRSPEVREIIKFEGGHMTKEEMDHVISKIDLSPDVRALPDQERAEVILGWLDEFRGKPPKASPTPTRTIEYNDTRPRLHVPKNKSVIGEVREAMHAFPNDSTAASKSISMGGDNHRALRRMILIESRPTLPQEDRDKIKACFEIIERDRQMVSVRKTIDAMTAKHWAKKKDPRYVLNHRRKRFGQNITAICESCESTVNMDLPNDLSKDDVLRTVGELSRSMELIGRLMRKLVGNEEEK